MQPTQSSVFSGPKKHLQDKVLKQTVHPTSTSLMFDHRYHDHVRLTYGSPSSTLR